LLGFFFFVFFFFYGYLWGIRAIAIGSRYAEEDKDDRDLAGSLHRRCQVFYRQPAFLLYPLLTSAIGVKRRLRPGS